MHKRYRFISFIMAFVLVCQNMNTFSILAQEEEVIEETNEEVTPDESPDEEEITLNPIVKILERDQTDPFVSIEVTLDENSFASVKLPITGDADMLLEDFEVSGTTYTFSNEFEIGEYEVNSVIIDDEEYVLDQPVAFSVKEEEINVDNEIYYTEYAGIDYYNQTRDSKRLAVLQKGVDMITICWTAPFDMPTWKDDSGYASWATDMNGERSQYFMAGHTYSGLPYTMNSTGRRYNDVSWASLIQDPSVSLSTFSGSYTFSDGTRVSNTSIKGTDCSAFVCSCLNAIASTEIMMNTTSMMRSDKFVKVTGSTREERFKNLQPGDVLINSSHAMLYAGRDEEGNIYTFESLYNKSSCLCTYWEEDWVIYDYEAYRYYELCDVQPVTVDPTYDNYLPISTYTNQTTLQLYNVNREKSGTLSSGSTLFSILDFYSDGMCYIQYSTSSGKKTAYAKTSNFFSGSNLTDWTSNAQYTVYRTDTSTTTTEKLEKDKNCIVLSTKNGRQEIIYPTSSGYYHGWIVPLSSQEAMKGHSISLNGDICLKFYLELGDSITSNSDATLIMTTPSGTQSVNVSSVTKNSSGYYIFPCKVSAKDLTSTITAQLDLGDNLYGKKYTYRIEDYTNAIINNPSSYAAKTVSIAKAMMTYGYYVQQYFGYNTNKLPSKINTLDNKDLSKFNYVLSDQSSTVDFIGARLVLSTRPGIKLYFNGDASFKVNGSSVTTTKEGKYTVITIADISNFEKLYTITTTNFSLKYYLFSYGINSSNTKITNLMQALYAYNLSLK